MRRYWISKDSIQSDQVHFKDDVFHHIFDVCRQGVGHNFEILIGDQKAYLIEVTDVRKREAYGKIISSREIPSIPHPHIHLALSIPRFPVMETIVEKAVECGIHTIHPFFSDFSFVRKASALPESKLERWNKIVISATQQCGRGELMKIALPIDFKNILTEFNRTKDRMGLFAYEGDTKVNIRDYLQSAPTENLTEVWVFVGSEGGFSKTETQEFQQVGLSPVTLGEQVLRVETACITLAAILKYEFRMF